MLMKGFLRRAACTAGLPQTKDMRGIFNTILNLKPHQLGKNSTAVIKIQELEICEIQLLISFAKRFLLNTESSVIRHLK